MRMFMQKIKNIIKRAVTTNDMQDGGTYPIVQVQYYDKTATVEVLTPYGLCSSPPVGSMATIFNVLGDEANRTAIVDSPRNRFKTKPGEVAVGNYISKAKIHFLQDGSVLLDVPNGEVTINTTRVTMTGDLRVKGDIIDRYETNSNNLGGMRTIYNTHTHNENDVPNDTDPPNQPM